MSERERGESRAQGALDNFLKQMAEKLEQENRSKEYIEAFWREMRCARIMIG